MYFFISIIQIFNVSNYLVKYLISSDALDINIESSDNSKFVRQFNFQIYYFLFSFSFLKRTNISFHYTISFFNLTSQLILYNLFTDLNILFIEFIVLLVNFFLILCIRRLIKSILLLLIFKENSNFNNGSKFYDDEFNLSKSNQEKTKSKSKKEKVFIELKRNITLEDHNDENLKLETIESESSYKNTSKIKDINKDLFLLDTKKSKEYRNSVFSFGENDFNNPNFLLNNNNLSVNTCNFAAQKSTKNKFKPISE